MKKFHVITGLPRTASTLLCNLLSQNPRFHCSRSTSHLPGLLGAVSATQTASSENHSDFIRNPKQTENRALRILRGIVENYYHGIDAPVIFDKSRGWPFHYGLLKRIYPKSKLIVLVRNPVEVFASIERQHQNTALWDQGAGPAEKTIAGRAEMFFNPQDGIIGSCMVAVEDLLRRGQSDAIMLQHESLVDDPELMIRRLYKQLGERYYSHDYTKVEDLSEDVDELYWGKFPHGGSGKIEKREPIWPEVISKEFAQDILGRYPYYCRQLEYGVKQ